MKRKIRIIPYRLNYSQVKDEKLTNPLEINKYTKYGEIVG